MSIKYSLRADLFKLQGVRQRLFREHARILLLTRPPLSWGSIEAQLHQLFSPEETDALNDYILARDINEMIDGIVRASQVCFSLTRSICEAEGVAYPELLESELRASLERRIGR